MKLRNKQTGEITDNIYVYEGLLCVDVWKGKSGYYNTLTELNEEWEDYYMPKEPLIKDEKIRKAVRAWAEVNSIEGAIYAERLHRSLCLLTDMGEDDYNIEFVGWIPTLKDGEAYTITELCGEGE